MSAAAPELKTLRARAAALSLDDRIRLARAAGPDGGARSLSRGRPLRPALPGRGRRGPRRSPERAGRGAEPGPRLPVDRRSAERPGTRSSTASAAGSSPPDDAAALAGGARVHARSADPDAPPRLSAGPVRRGLRGSFDSAASLDALATSVSRRRQRRARSGHPKIDSGRGRIGGRDAAPGPVLRPASSRHRPPHPCAAGSRRRWPTASRCCSSSAETCRRASVPDRDQPRPSCRPSRRAPGGFAALVHPDGTPVHAGRIKDSDAETGCSRLFRRLLAPDVVLVEAFPFGRRADALRARSAARARAVERPCTARLIACSVRDILQQSRPERRAETLALLRRFFGLVLVHGDPRLAPAARRQLPRGRRTSPTSSSYTGMVGPERAAAQLRARAGTGDARAARELRCRSYRSGGGAVGSRLVAAAIAARPLTAPRRRRGGWCSPVPNGSPADGPPDGAPASSVRPFVPDLAALLARARVSVSRRAATTPWPTSSRPAAAPCWCRIAEGGETEQTAARRPGWPSAALR